MVQSDEVASCNEVQWNDAGTSWSLPVATAYFIIKVVHDREKLTFHSISLLEEEFVEFYRLSKSIFDEVLEMKYPTIFINSIVGDTIDPALRS